MAPYESLNVVHRDSELHGQSATLTPSSTSSRNDAIVVDEGEERHGTTEIRRWADWPSSKYAETN